MHQVWVYPAGRKFQGGPAGVHGGPHSVEELLLSFHPHSRRLAWDQNSKLCWKRLALQLLSRAYCF